MMTFEQMQAIIAEILETQRQTGLRQEELSQRQQQFEEKMEQEMSLFLARQRELQEGDLRLQSKLDQLSERHEQLSQRYEQFHEKVQQEINMFLATQRELQESDLRRQSELAQASQERAEISQQIQGLTRIAESLVTNAQISDRITEDHEERIRRLEQE